MAKERQKAEEWQRVAGESDLKPGQPVAARFRDATGGEQEVYLVRLQDRICACGNKCTHYGGTLTDGGLIDDGVQVCPLHNAHFDAATGRMLLGPALDDLPAWEVKTRGGDVLVRPAGPVEIPMPAGRDDRTFLIVGGGAAAEAAAEMLRRQGFAGRIRIITRETDLPYDRTMLSKDYLAGTAKASWVPLRKKPFYERLQIEFLTGRTVTGLDPDRRRVTLDDGQILDGERILLATGGIPRALDIPGGNLPGCFLLRSLADCRTLMAEAQKGRRAVIVGASFIGMETAAALRTRGLEVDLVGREGVPLARVFGEAVGRRLQRMHEERGVVFHLGATPRRIGGEGRVEWVELDGGERLPADLVVIGVGIVPAVGFLEGSGLVEQGGGAAPAVPVDARLRTRAEGIYAAGDIALVPPPAPADARPLRVEHWVVAERHGQHAARAMLGAEDPYQAIPFFWTRHYDTSVKYLGWGGDFDRVVFRGDVEGGNFLAGYYRQGRLTAAAAVGFGKALVRVEQILRRGLTVAPERLADRSFDLAAALGG